MMKRKAIRIASPSVTLMLKNSLETGTVFYGLHMSEGLAHYKPHGEKEFTVFVDNQTIKLMNSSFCGKPVYVGHVDEHTPLSEADGVVADSFYNKSDGKHWCKFIITTQKGLDAIAAGHKLSNSLVVNKHSRGGEWHGLSFDRTVDQGTFHHLAVVPNPRYAESEILSPEEFKQYNKEKEAELEMLSNSKETPMFKLFKNEAHDDKETKKLLSTMVHLPKTKRNVTIEKLCNEADEAPAKDEAAEEKFDLDGAMVSFKELMDLYKKLKAEFDSLEIVEEEVDEMAMEADQLSNSGDDEDEVEEDELDNDLEIEDLDEDALDALDAADVAKEEKLSNSKNAVKKVAVKKGNNAAKLKNASDSAHERLNNSTRVVDLSSDQIKRGQARYGSNKK